MRAVSVSSLTRRLAADRASAAWRPAWSAAAALRAARTTLVMPGVLLFAGFGSFATLLLVTFAGTRRDKLIAHAGLAIAGSALLAIGPP